MWRRDKSRARRAFWFRYAKAKGLSLAEVYRRIATTRKEGPYGRGREPAHSKIGHVREAAD